MCGVEVENIMFDRSESNGNYLEHNKRVSMFITFNTVPILFTNSTYAYRNRHLKGQFYCKLIAILLPADA